MPPDAPAQIAARGAVRLSAGLSGHLHPVQAAEQVAAQCDEGLAGAHADLAILFLSGQHAESARAIAHAIRTRLQPTLLIGVSGEAVLGGESELEGVPGVSLLAAALPGVSIQAFRTDHLPLVPDPAVATEDALRAMAQAAGLGPDHRATFLFADPFSVPANALLPALARARSLVAGHSTNGSASRRGGHASPIIGGMASASPRPGGNVLLINDTIMRAGGVGVSLSGPVRVDSLVSQGCKPIGPTMVVTGGKGQMITTLGGRKAMDVLSEVLESIDDATKEKLRRGLFLGRAINEYKERFGRDDFLIRNVVGVDRNTGAIAVADLLRVGQTVQFHCRDQATAAEDLALLLDAQRLYDPPAGALLFTCNGRGQRLFDKPHHDAAMISRAFAPPASAEDLAKMGQPLPSPLATRAGSSIPLAGYFAAGEIGPIGDQVFVHGQTACVALFRPESGQ